jgi:hypothetical protein
MRSEAEKLLSPSTNILTIPQPELPAEYADFERMVGIMKTQDPVKAKQFYDLNIDKYR